MPSSMQEQAREAEDFALALLAEEDLTEPLEVCQAIH